MDETTIRHKYDCDFQMYGRACTCKLTASERMLRNHDPEELERRHEAYLEMRRQRDPHLVKVQEHLKNGGTRENFDG